MIRRPAIQLFCGQALTSWWNLAQKNGFSNVKRWVLKVSVLSEDLHRFDKVAYASSSAGSFGIIPRPNLAP